MRPGPPVSPQDNPGPGRAPYVSALHRSWLAEDAGRRWQDTPGTLVFADVSGFTPLAERLARRGKVGAEELTDTLNAVFRELLGVAAGFGGDCLKFGGDALLLLFTGDGHARRGVAAAHAMQSALRALRRQRAAAGIAKLDISMGVHSGDVHAFSVGTSHRELVLAGPAVTRTLQLEADAQGGQVLVSDEAAAEAGDHDPGAAAPVAPAPEPDDDGAATLGIPEALRPHLDGGRKDGEHRLASVGFLKFGGTDRILAEAGPDALADALDGLVQAVQAACADHGVTFLGTDVDQDGGKVILATGMPSASPDDEDRLLLALRGACDAHASEALPVRAGVHRGRIFAVDLGSPQRRTFTVMGDAVNLAARVMGAAGWHQVVATQQVLELRRTEFALEPLPPFAVKGKAEPVHAQVVGPAVGRRADPTAGGGPLIGRGREVQVIREAFAGAHRGAGSVVEVVGEPGIGKSKLTSAVTDLDHTLVRMTFEAGRYSLATPYFALRRGLRAAMGLTLETPAGEVAAALQEIVEASAPDLLPWLPLLGVPLGLELPDTPETSGLDAGRRLETLHAAVTRLMEVVLASPTLITVEDAHWLDAASGDLLRALLTQIERRPWAVLVTRRPIDGGLDLGDVPAVARLVLEPLDRDALVELATIAGEGTVLPPGVLDEFIERSGGNPLFLQEIVRANALGSIDEVPETVEAVVAASIDTLPAQDRATLRQAAVLGGRFPRRVLATMLDVAPGALSAELGALSHFLVAEGSDTVRFRHILLRDVAYEGLAYRVRRALHERAGTILESSTGRPEAMAELLALHFHRADRFESSWHWSQIAAERARHNGASVEAASFYEQALEAGRRLPGVDSTGLAEVAERLGDVCELSGRYARSSAAYLLARRLATGDAPRRVRLCRKLGYLRDHEGRYRAAQQWFARGLREVAQVDDGRDAARLWAELTTATVSSRIRQGRHARAAPLIEAAIRSAEASGDRAALAHAYFVYDQLLTDQGRYVEANHSERAARIYEELGDHRGAASAYNEVGNTAYWLGRWDDAVASYQRAIEADRRAGALVYNAIYLNNIGEIRSDQGRWAEAGTLLRDAHDLWTAGGWRIGTGWAGSNLGRLAAREGRMDDAAAHLAAARALLAEIGAEAMLLETDVREMERLVLAGDHPAALAVAEPLAERAERLHLVNVGDLVRRVAGYAWAQAGDPDRGWPLLEACLRSSRDAEAEYEVALTLQAMVRVGALLGWREAGVAAAEAAGTFDRLGVVATPTFPLPTP